MIQRDFVASVNVLRFETVFVVVSATPGDLNIVVVDVLTHILRIYELQDFNGSLRQKLFDDLKCRWKEREWK